MDGKIGHAPNIAHMIRIHADRRHFDHLRQHVLILRPRFIDESLYVLLIDHL
jgi:hypothetical protein